MVKLNDYSGSHVETLHTFKGHRAWSKAYRMLTRLLAQDHSSEHVLYLTGA